MKTTLFALAATMAGLFNVGCGSSKPPSTALGPSAPPTSQPASPLSIKIDGPRTITSLDQPIPFTVDLANASDHGIVGMVVFSATEGFVIAGDNQQPFALEAGAKQTMSVALRPAGALCNAHYALHARAIPDVRSGSDPAAHEMLVFEIKSDSLKPAWTETYPNISPREHGSSRADEALIRTQQNLALAHARAALNDPTPPSLSWKLQSDAGTFGVSMVTGPGGLADAAIAFVSANGSMVFRNFDIVVGKTPLDFSFVPNVTFENGVARVDYHILVDNKPATCRAEIFAESGALRIRFSMPGTQRNVQGHPRYTDLALGVADRAARRVYGGMGNVVEDPQDLDLPAGGVHLSTRHVAVEFENGLALLQASDIFPDAFKVNAYIPRYSLHTHHDATITLLPSAHGAFAAARAYRAIAQFKAPPDVAWLEGRMCLDQWNGDYLKAAQDIERAARFGLTDCVFVKHAWQRWGYDYRLPEIYPPMGNVADFNRMAEACRKTGILFCPHDNYVDFYPDAEGFSYRHIIFNPDGTPQRAWFNKGRNAQSYRWLPTAFLPWMEKNLVLVRDGIAPGAYFTDVFSAIPPMDFFDQAGRFYPKTVTIDNWAHAIDRMRDVLGAATISEDGVDAFVGHLASGQSDHGPATRSDNYFAWRAKAADSERVPWHDMASHGAFVLFAGGLSDRYVADEPGAGGYGSDDYITNTVIGGRNPMADGPFSRRAVMTYWLTHDVCAQLARRDIVAHEFGDDNIHRQHVTFSDGGEVWTNRGDQPWTVDGITLPKWGMLARVGKSESVIATINGARVAWSRMGDTWFFDARPPLADGVGAKSGSLETKARKARNEPGPETHLPRQFVDFGPVSTDGAFRLKLAKRSIDLTPLPDGPDFRVVLQMKQLGTSSPHSPRITAYDESGQPLPAPQLQQHDDDLEFTADSKAFRYAIQW